MKWQNQFNIRWYGIPQDEHEKIRRELVEISGLSATTDEFVLMLRGPYNPSVKERVEQYCDSYGLLGALKHSIWIDYEDCDYQQAQLTTISVPEVLLSECKCLERKCGECKRFWHGSDNSLRFQTPKTKEKIFTTYSRVLVGETNIAKTLLEDLKGLRMASFDHANKFSYLFAGTSLGNPILDASTCIDFSGYCSVCKRPLFTKFFGSRRFDAKDYNGDDVVWDPFLNTLALSHKGFARFSACFPKVTREYPIFLE